MNSTQFLKMTFNLMAKTNNMSIEYERMKYELKHITWNYIKKCNKKWYKRGQNRYRGHLMPA